MRTVALYVAQVFEAFLKMQRHRIINLRANVVLG